MSSYRNNIIAQNTSVSTTVYGWLFNDCGQLGTGDFTNSATPITPANIFSDVRMCAAGNRITWVLLQSGELYGCGVNKGLGVYDGSTNYTKDPSLSLYAAGVQAVACQGACTVILYTNGDITVIKGKTAKYTVTPSTPIVHVSAGLGANDAIFDAAMLDIDGNLYFIKNGSITKTGTGHHWSSFSTGAYHIVALDASGMLYGWGTNVTKAMGDAIAGGATVHEPVLLNNYTFKFVYGWYYSTRGILTDGSLLGYNTKVPSSTEFEFSQLYEKVGIDVNGALLNVSGTTVSRLAEGIWLNACEGDTHCLAIKQN